MNRKTPRHLHQHLLLLKLIRTESCARNYLEVYPPAPETMDHAHVQL